MLVERGIKLQVWITVVNEGLFELLNCLMEECPRGKKFVCTMDKCFHSAGFVPVRALAASVEAGTSSSGFAVHRCCIRFTAAIYVNA